VSHWVKIKTKLISEEYVKAALNRMGIKFSVGSFTIGQGNEASEAQIRFDSHTGLSRQKDGTWALVGDPYYTPQLKKYYRNNAGFSQELSTAYAVEQTTRELENNQFSCTDNPEARVGQDGLIRMTFERFC
jgi:hypothetical protein